MSIKLLCVVCSRGSEEFSVVRYLDANGDALIKQNLCDKCRAGRKLKCAIHREAHVVLIDGSSVCASCVRKQWMEIHDGKPAYWQAQFHTLAKHVPRTDHDEFLRIMRCATDERRAWVGQCLVTALVVLAHRRNTSFAVAHRYATRFIPRSKTFFTILPSSNPNYRYVH